MSGSGFFGLAKNPVGPSGFEFQAWPEHITTSFIFTLYFLIFLYVLIVSGVFIIAFFFSKLVVFGGKRNFRTFDSSYCLCQNSLELCLCRRRPLSGPKCSSRLLSIDYGRTTIKCTRGRPCSPKTLTPLRLLEGNQLS